MLRYLVGIVLATFLRNVLGLTPNDYLITSLPLLHSSVNFNQYAGYMALGDEDETSMFFWFVESQNNPATAPVVLWLNGGPGSSSIAYGFWTEHGPFRLAPNAVEVDIYDWSWNQIANVIYLESPSGVGFSYSNKPTGYNCSDSKTAHINYLFLLRFFEVFTQFQNNDFYVTGESYGGHYVPQLSQMILEQNNTINMKGFVVFFFFFKKKKTMLMRNFVMFINFSLISKEMYILFV
ncbi:hypothetical protein RFI_32196 [Reticulomyxa filosa]|uniref:Carboxypeptidase n=1 Tax=Reticulomyxa filosa TaxID=46433 RepID=X6LWT7_RETFI|nr:hypothetical protein RFI_32196 [Reticulomyxa filosa]|eukprot:ETO05200.1 hypothetical protein RFI_32196 [Reticulomyxa filosa]